jgi:hypothetical protein
MSASQRILKFGYRRNHDFQRDRWQVLLSVSREAGLHVRNGRILLKNSLAKHPYAIFIQPQDATRMIVAFLIAAGDDARVIQGLSDLRNSKRIPSNSPTNGADMFPTDEKSCVAIGTLL